MKSVDNDEAATDKESHTDLYTSRGIDKTQVETVTQVGNETTRNEKRVK